MNKYAVVFRALSENAFLANELLKILNSELSMPNIPAPTMGGEVFWTNLYEYNGWKLQQNSITHHARILDQNNKRIAWGTVNGMNKVLDRMVEYASKYDEYKPTMEEALESMEKLKKLKESLDSNIITEDEYEEKRKEILKRI